MSRGADYMKSVARDTWRFGYLFVDSSNTTGRQELDVIRCEINFLLGETANVTLFCQIYRINRSFKEYELFFFEDERGENLMAFADVGYVDSFSNSIQIDFSIVGDPRFGWLTEDIVRILHPLIWTYLIHGVPPMKAGKPASVWYLGLTGKNITELEYASKKILRPIILTLGQIMSR